MASAQVLPSSVSKKQGHLEAGKRRLEEFRKKKAAERAKKSSSSQLSTADGGFLENQPSEADFLRRTTSDGAGTSTGNGGTISEFTSSVVDNESNTTEHIQNNELGPSRNAHFSATVNVTSYNTQSADMMQTPARDQELKGYYDSWTSEPVNHSYQERATSNFGFPSASSGRTADEVAIEQSLADPPSVLDSHGISSQYSYYGLEKTILNNNSSLLNNSIAMNSSAIHDGVMNVSSQRFRSSPPQITFDHPDSLGSGHMSSLHENSVHLPSATRSNFEGEQNANDILEYNSPTILDVEERTLGGSVGHLTSGNITSPWSSNPSSMDIGIDTRNSSGRVSLSPSLSGIYTKRSRPSFLDSITVSSSSAGFLPYTETKSTNSFASKVHPFNVSASSNLQDATKSSFASANGDGPPKHGINGIMDMKHDFHLHKQDEDFAALEQHIEDLTQEKFSLQRSLDASRTLAESLAAENSALTDTYNQQGSVVNQLKTDIEKLQEEIKAQLLELQSLRMEYANAQLECNASDERAKLLASEVITLEEKALRLRSSELKLEKQLENLQSELYSCKRKISSLEKDRLDLQSTIDALQEEKKVLQSKLRKASNGKLVDIGKSSTNRRDVSTSTEDLGDRDDSDAIGDMSNQEVQITTSSVRDTSGFALQPENSQVNLNGSYLSIPPDQMRMIQNINLLISELALEKEELMQALSTESSLSSKLKELNNELSRKLEVQTQRFELLTAQSMTHDNIPARQPDTRIMTDNTPYADEGDEVVERVLGWIMKLFPGGPSRRRTSKLL